MSAPTATKAALVAAYRARLEASGMAWVDEPGRHAARRAYPSSAGRG